MAERKSPQSVISQYRDDERLDLIIKFSDGLMSSTEVETFNKRLRQDAQLRELYVAMCLQRRELRKIIAPIASVQEASLGADDKERANLILEAAESERRSRIEREASAALERQQQAASNTERQESMRMLAGLSTPDNKPQTRHYVIPKPLFYGSIAAAIAILAAIIWPLLQPTPQPSRPEVKPPVVVATLMSQDNAVWQGSGRPRTAGDPIWNSPLFLEQGWAKIQFNNGAHVMIEAPAKFTPEDDDRIIFDSGKLVGYCSEQARGFVVATRGAVVKDLGTEFAVDAAATRTDVHVFDGLVQTSIPGITSGEMHEISAGKAVRVSHRSKLVESIELQPDQFLATRRVPIEIRNTGEGLWTGDSDRNWRIVGAKGDPDFVPHSAIVMRPHKEHLPNDPEASQWLSWAVDSSNSPHGAVYTFRTTFDINDNFDPNNARLRLRIIVDDEIDDIRLNHNSLEETPRGRLQADGEYFEFVEFEIDDGFVVGSNILEFDVYNQSDTVALRVEIAGDVLLGSWWENP